MTLPAVFVEMGVSGRPMVSLWMAAGKPYVTDVGNHTPDDTLDLASRVIAGMPFDPQILEHP